MRRARVPQCNRVTRLAIMRPLGTTCFSICAIGAFALASAGCAFRGLGEHVAEAVVAQTLAPATELAYSIGTFREASKRWPRDYAELSAFLERRGANLQLTNYAHIDFTERTNGDLEIYAVGPSWTNRIT